MLGSVPFIVGVDFCLVQQSISKNTYLKGGFSSSVSHIIVINFAFFYLT